jgi:hypothetical protein
MTITAMILNSRKEVKEKATQFFETMQQAVS